MKAKKPSPSKAKPKLSFSVDRSEFDISSDWVQAVMAQPSLSRSEAPFFSPPINNATDASSTTAESKATEEISASVAEIATGGESGPVPELNTTEEKTTTVAEFLAEVGLRSSDRAIHTSTVAKTSPVRVWKMRPLRRVTDGLTPGQYAVYSLMLANGEVGTAGERVYRGGYADLGRLTGLSKRGIQNVIAELQEKAVITLHTAPGHHRSQTSAYLVPSPEAVVDAWRAHGWRFAVGKSKALTNGATVAVSSSGQLNHNVRPLESRLQ